MVVVWGRGYASEVAREFYSGPHISDVTATLSEVPVKLLHRGLLYVRLVGHA
jgi:hypothetical protein